MSGDEDALGPMTAPLLELMLEPMTAPLLELMLGTLASPRRSCVLSARCLTDCLTD